MGTGAHWGEWEGRGLDRTRSLGLSVRNRGPGRLGRKTRSVRHVLSPSVPGVGPSPRGQDSTLNQR